MPSTGAAIELPDGHGPFLPFGIYGVLAAMPFAVWLFLAIEQLPLAAEKSADPKRDMPKGIMLGMFTLIVLGFLVLIFNPAIPITREIDRCRGVHHDRARRLCARHVGRADPRRLPRDFRLERREGAWR